MGQNANIFGYALNTVAAAGADFSVSNGDITLTGVGTLPFDKITTGIQKQVYVAAVARVTALTFAAPAAVGQVYQVVIEQPTENAINRFPVTITVSSTDTSATTIAQAFKTAFEAEVTAGLLAGTASGGAEIITITGTTARPMLRVVSISAGITQNPSTPGNPAVNLGSQLLTEGVVGATPTGEYTTFTFQNLTPTGMVTNDGVFRGIVYAIDENAANASTLIDQMTAVFGGATSASSPEANAALLGKL